MSLPHITRRQFVGRGSRAALAGLAADPLIRVLHAQQQPGAAPADPNAANQAPAPSPFTLLQNLRQAGSTTPIQTSKLRDTIFLLQGVGGNIVVQIGPDGKLMVDSSVATAAPQLRQSLDKLDAHPLKLLINTHWHFDHTDGNAAMHDAGAFIMAHENTRTRLATQQELKAYHAQFPASPTSALPQETFAESENLFVNNDEIDLVHMPSAHTDSDIYVLFKNANVLHTGDIWFNGMYPLIDDGTGGTINGMIRAVDTCLGIADDKTKIVPGHGPLGDKATLNEYREMLATVATRIEKLKSSGQTVDQVVAAKPTGDIDAVWAKGNVKPDLFVTLVYNTLP
jgi:cyclase